MYTCSPGHLPWSFRKLNSFVCVVLQRERTGNMRDVIQRLENIVAAETGSVMQRDTSCARHKHGFVSP